MKKQITFEGYNAMGLAIEWLDRLAYCFNIKSAKIQQLNQPYYASRYKVRVVVIYA